ncbi:hypothetical protein FJ414_30590 [Mesorhizobium sp. B3-1-6]|uniref:hypothetical protein n=1 Tax=unclassified Mesorhizobium TaxID=325217 RepID=UPI0011284288|nr:MULTISPECIES: hypothetical protein [unclassified Mesorhizobium]TPI26130.1 hypothetical protein FJ414_30590 [Mesorhizobium sp. B3-1-6]TPI55692.1 hypothetical protein FJ417_23965 [Mesorhizobium sp. B3-1-7]UCI24990.1 hypothetical protein FJ430_25980 [Mesorhizobium sp. B2-8-5]
MTDILTTGPTAVRRLKLPRPSIPRLAMLATFNTMFSSMVNARKAAYLDPFTSLDRRPPIIPEDDLEGRNPNW